MRFALSILCLALLPLPAPAQELPVDFGDQVRPILARSCLPCHGFDPSTREAGVRLDTFDGATFERPHGLGAAIVPGDPDFSVLVEKVRELDPRDRMPPEGEPLTEGEIELLERWIEEGAHYERHWSLQAPRAVAPPRASDPAWDTNPVDRFVFAAIDAAGLAPAPEADRRALLRRASFDLVGLPPTPKEVAAFESDNAPGAWERQVDRLLASPHYAERQARHWLDLMRFAETYAHEFDYPIPEAWRYRDYVIRAFEDDVPYDDLVREHLAGDLLAEPRVDPVDGANASIRGTGWWWLSQGTHAPVDVRADEAQRIDNQIDVLSKSFLATTISCARCHDHKFDPILQSEYYGLAGFVQSSRRQLAFLDPRGAVGQGAAGLRDLDANAREQLHALAAQRADELGERVRRGLRAAQEVVGGSRRPGERGPAPDRMLFDFDGGDWSGFEVEGDAFGPAPWLAGTDPLRASGTARGAGFANSHARGPNESSVQTDLRRGVLRSDEFLLDRRRLHFLIGGGNHPSGTGVRLLVDGQVAREATGHNSLELIPHSFDLDELRGERGRIEVFDQVEGGWGNIRADHFVLSDAPDLEQPLRRSMEVVASQFDLELSTVERWVASAARLPREAGPLAPGRAAPWGRRGDWTPTGWAFERPEGEPVLWRSPAARLEPAGDAEFDSGLVSDALLGVLRSPTFEITAPFLLVPARGRGTLRVIVDGYTLDEFNALLFESARHVVDAPGWIVLSHDLSKWIGHRAHYEIHDDRTDGSIRVGRPRWSDVAAPAPAAGEVLGADARAAGRAVARFLGGEADGQGAALVAWALAEGLVELPHELPAAFAGREAELPRPLRALAMADGDGEDEFVFHRGDSAQPMEPAPRRFPGLFGGGEPLGDAAGSGRLALAEALLSESNPVAARVPVNRIWQQLFGRGLVPTPDDFGLLGEPPSHPELLDHLSLRFRGELDWSTKALVRELVLSRAYRTACVEPSAELLAVDPSNTLLSIRRPRRLDAESLRDALLAVSGRLDPARFGRSVAVHLTEFQQGRGRPGHSGPRDGDGRRSIYLEVRRNFPTPLLRIFDCPDPHSTRGLRARSNVPAQSLALMNDPFVHDQAERLAARALERAGGETSAPGARIVALFELALQRAPSPTEAADFAAVDLALADLAHVLLQSKEFSFIE
ncbi:PSD1 and planctomycete cytochrome C domain-containing protein [Engelhardtia mirabilis]|uniref:Planctomycete cytochrome C n=1 Tax=Engelhardtia mirabilis TaxID=2528011 RepID=A0A518BQ68_9BACT|nr:Planctomycete cytochrome C [Planctomycetes bacterium Pla133]QDV03438.1 Planctomycete cytochrome C [Planctomycetes bacterium Pla86]